MEAANLPKGHSFLTTRWPPGNFQSCDLNH